MMKVGDTIQFRYKGNRFVKGEVDYVRGKIVVLILQTDYLGKNEDWFIGEKKAFNKSEIKKLFILST